eukprot:4266387-Pleurochrysis_carterae.AAC.2
MSPARLRFSPLGRNLGLVRVVMGTRVAMRASTCGLHLVSFVRKRSHFWSCRFDGSAVSSDDS